MKNPLEKLRIQRQNMQRAISANIVDGVDITRDKRWDFATDKFIRLAEIAAKAQDAVGNTKNAVTLLNQALRTNEAQAKLQGIDRLLDKYNNKLKTTNQVTNQAKVVKPDYKSRSDELKQLISDQRNRMENIKIDTPQWQREANKLGVYIRELGRLTLATKGSNEALKFLKRNFDNIYAMGNTTAKANTISFLQDIATKAKVSKEELNKLLSVQERIAKAQANIPKTSEQKLTAQIANMRAAYDKNNAIANTSKWNVAVQQLIQMASNADKASGSLRVLEDAWRRFGETLGQKFGLDKALQEFNQGKAKIDAQLKQIRDEAKAQTPQAQQKKAEAQSLANAKAQVQAKKEERQQRELNAKLQAAEEKLSARQQQQLRSFQREYNKFRNDIANHTGEGQAFYTQKQFTAAENRMNRLIEKAERLKDVLGHKFTNRLPNQLQTLLDGTNKRNNVDTRWAETLQQRISRLNEETARFYSQWQKTGNFKDRFNFQLAALQLREARKEAEKLESSMQKAFKLFDMPKKTWEFLQERSKWAMSGLFSNILWDIPSQVVQSYAELEKAMAGVQQVLPLIEGKAKEVTAEFEKLSNIASGFGRDTQEVVEAAQLWGRGYGKGDVSALDDKTTAYVKNAEAVATTNELVRQSAILATVDNFNMADSVRGLEAVLAAYGLRAKSAAEATLFAGRAVDIITKVSHRGQISAQELVQGLQATGKAAEQAGVSLSFLTALIETGVRNTGMSGSNIGNALKSMMVGLQSDKAIEEMRKFGVEAMKVGTDGVTRMRPMEEVILEIAAALNTGDVNAKNLLLRISGGKMQFSKVSAILRDGAEIMRMWGEAADSAGFAQEQLKVQLDTFATKLNTIKADVTLLFQDLAGGNVGSTLKSVLDGLDSILKKIHESSGAIQTLGGVLAGYLAIRNFTKLFNVWKLLTAYVNEYRVAMGLTGTVEATAGVIKGTLTNAIGLQTKEQIVNTVATNLNAGAKASNTAATTANATAIAAGIPVQQAENVVLSQKAVLMTAVTGGLNILIGVLAASTAYSALNTDALNENTDAHQDNQVALSQQLQAEQDLSKWIENGSKMYMTYKKAVDDVNTSDEKRKELIKEMEFMKAKFLSVLSKEEAQMLNNAQTSAELEEAFKSIIAAHQEKTKQTLEDLKAEKKAEIDKYEKEVEIHEKQLTNYQKNLDGFKAWSEGQIRGLDIAQKAWVNFYNIVASITGWLGTQMGTLGDEQAGYIAKLQTQLDATDNLAEKAVIQEQLANARSNLGMFKTIGDTFSRTSEKAKAKIDAEIANTSGAFSSAIKDTQTQLGTAASKLATARAELARLEKMEDLDPYGGNPDKGGIEQNEKGGKGKKNGGRGHHKKQQIMYSTDVEKAIHNMMADGAFSDDGWTHSLLKALVDYNGGNIADLSKISSKIEEYFRPEANKSDPMEIAYAFQQFALNNSNQKGWEGVIEQLYGAAADTVKAKLKNDAEWIDNNFTWKNSYKGIYGETLNVLDGLNKGMKEWVGKSMDLAGVGCVEAVEKIGAFYSEFLKEQFDANVRYIPTLLENAKKQGIDVVAFDESKLEVGDLVTWANPGDYNNHIGIFTGYKDGKAMVADNSSGENKILERELYRSWQAVESIVKTGGGNDNKIPWVNSRKKDSIYEWDGDRKNRADNKVKEQYKWQEKAYEIEVERAKLEQEFTGDTISYQKAINQLRELHIKQMSNYIDETQEAYDKGMASLNAYINNSKTIQAALKRAKVTSFNDLSEAEQKDLLDKNAKNGDDRAKNAVKIYEMLKQIKEELPKARVNLQQEKNALRSDNGYMKPEDRYKWQKQLVNDWDATSHDNRLLQADRNLELDLIELQRLEVEIAKAKQAEEAEINKKLAKRLELETEIAKLNQKETLTDKDKDKLEGLNATYKELGEDIDNLRTNHSKTYRDIAQQYNQQTKATKESIKAVRDVVNEYKQAGADITVDFFDKLINEGSSLGDAIEDLRKEIAKIAIKWFTYNAFNLPINNETFGNSPLETLLVHSQNKGEQDLTPMGLNTTATDLNTQELKTLNQQIASGKLNIANISQNNPFSPNGITSPVTTPAITAYSNSMQAVGEQMNNPMGTVLQNLGSHLTQISSTMSQFLTQKLQELPIEQQKLLLEQQGLSLEQFNQAVMTENAIAAQTNTQAQLQNATSTDLNTQAINTASAKTSAGGGFGAFNILGFLPMLLAWLFQGDKKGGSLDKFAKGGKPTNGLIKGAGTGTSDSILTYLEHKRKFIRTSDGEYIINAKATDKLGVGTLDAINKNPELFNEMLLEKKGLATGGGVDMTPTMKPSTAQTYKSYTQTKAQLSNPNGRMEELMAEQNGLISGIGKGNDGRIVVLNTQADSNAVMKAIHDNPKAFRNLLGQQQKRGFR